MEVRLEEIKNVSKKGKLKKSDQRQYDNAWDNFYESMRDFFAALTAIEELDDLDFSVDDLNQLSSRMDKLTIFIQRIGESINKNNYKAEA